MALGRGKAIFGQPLSVDMHMRLGGGAGKKSRWASRFRFGPTLHEMARRDQPDGEGRSAPWYIPGARSVYADSAVGVFKRSARCSIVRAARAFTILTCHSIGKCSRIAR